MKLIKRFQAVCVALAVAASGIFPVIGGEKYDEVNEEWQQAIIAAIDSFPENGGYYTVVTRQKISLVLHGEL